MTKRGQDMKKSIHENRRTHNNHLCLLIVGYVFSLYVPFIILSEIPSDTVFNIKSMEMPIDQVSVLLGSSILGAIDNMLVKVLSAGSPLLDNSVKAIFVEQNRKEEAVRPIYESLTNYSTGVAKTVGVWGPTSNSSYILEQREGSNQNKAIADILAEGFDEYYFLMSNFRNPMMINSTESLLRAADKLNLKIVVILLPPSEGGPHGNYDWKGWIDYFNYLKEKHPNSFGGFTIDDFNWISTRNDTRFKYNIDFMKSSDLMQALKAKREDVKFYPTIYFEGKKTNVITQEFLKYVDGVIAVSGCYYNVSALEPQLHLFREIFNKPIKYLVYPTITYNYSKLHYSPPSDRLVISTLSIASRIADGLIVWHEMDNPVIQDYLRNADNETYIAEMERTERLQIQKEHVESAGHQVLLLKNSTEIQNHCGEWYNKYTHTYNQWLNLSPFHHRDNIWKEKLFDVN